MRFSLRIAGSGMKRPQHIRSVARDPAGLPDREADSPVLKQPDAALVGRFHRECHRDRQAASPSIPQCNTAIVSQRIDRKEKYLPVVRRSMFGTEYESRGMEGREIRASRFGAKAKAGATVIPAAS
jgi:hypothetical protein